MLYWPETPNAELIASLQKADFSKLMDLFNSGVCVLECPKATGEVLCYPTAKMNANPAYANCQYYPGTTKVGSVSTRIGPAFRYNSINVLNHFCLPNAADYIKAEYLETIKTQMMSSTVGDTVG